MNGAICYAVGCVCEIDARKLMCGHHWAMVPAELQAEMDRASADYWLFAKRAVDAVEAVEQTNQQEAK